ncbi:MAG: integrase [Hydrocarboniphaga sp.]|uniref:tyrosine-type recombinase/integrase n=1 Tax=Hydrocarboniphaga sp. TaxID=2033016 RepID=UPI002625BE1C|nr:site-specific integrase [Hydrocarboniphaga sp.]MDB5971102.1 integrase [Hydrocarboniphaga sp.]
MAKVKLTKTVVDAAQAQSTDIELRDSMVPGFLCKVTPSGRKVFMIQYRTNAGVRRKPALGQFGELTVEQARVLAQDWLAQVRRGGDPGGLKAKERKAPTVKELCTQFMEDYSKTRNKPSTQRSNQFQIDRYIIPAFGSTKVHEVTRTDITSLMKRMEKAPSSANHALACLRKMFNLAELWGYRPDGSNPCRHVPKYPERGTTRLITDEQMGKLFAYLDQADAEGLENPSLTLAIRLQFEFAARMSEILLLEWDWVDLVHRRVVWPDSKTGDMSKPINEEAHRLLSAAPHYKDSRYVCPSLFNRQRPMTGHGYYSGWRRILGRAGVPHVGTHGVRHRATTDIANSGIPVKVGMALTAHKTVTMFMRYVHTEDDPVRAAAELVANRRKTVVENRKPASPEFIGSDADRPIKAVIPYRPRQRRNRGTQPRSSGSQHATGTSAESAEP